MSEVVTSLENQSDQWYSDQTFWCLPLLSSQEVNRVSEVVTSLADPSANVIFGAVIDDAVREC